MSPAAGYIPIPIEYNRPPAVDLKATAGGRGSFSYLNTKVYGTAQLPQGYVALQSGLVVPTHLIVPGSGGGARAPGKRYYGSRAIGFKPEGLVLLRLMKLG